MAETNHPTSAMVVNVLWFRVGEGMGWDGSNQLAPLQDPPQVFPIAFRVFEFLLSLGKVQGSTYEMDTFEKVDTLQA